MPGNEGQAQELAMGRQPELGPNTGMLAAVCVSAMADVRSAV